MTEKNIYQRINAIMSEVSYIQKEEKKVNNQYRFVSHDAVTAALHPNLVKHGVVVVPTVISHTQEWTEYKDKYDNTKFRGCTEVDINVSFVNSDDPKDKFDVQFFGLGIDEQDKGPGKAFSYAKKYAFLQVFCLETGDDPERDNIDKEPEKKPDRAKTTVAKDVNKAVYDLTQTTTDESLGEYVAGMEWKTLAAETRKDYPDMYERMVGEYKAHRERLQGDTVDIEQLYDDCIRELKNCTEGRHCLELKKTHINSFLKSGADASIIKRYETDYDQYIADMNRAKADN